MILKRYSIEFWLLNLSTFLFFFSFNVIIPEMPAYLSSMGGEDYKGYIIGLFTATAALSRPVSGKLADTIGRVPVMIFGGVICVLVSFLYPVFTTVYAFLFLRFLHGMSTGFMPTGTIAYLADLIPAERRGEAMGIVGIMNNIGFMAGNALSSVIVQKTGINNLFYISGVLAFLSVAVIFRMQESLAVREKFRWKQVLVKTADIIDKRAFDPAVTMFLTVITFGAMLTLIPDYSTHLGISNKGLFFLITTISTITVRIWAGRLSDRIGRLKTTLIGTAFWLISTLLLASLNLNLFYVAAITCGIATGMNSPALFAWAVDLAKGEKSGRVMATLFVAMEVGISFGAFVSAAIYANYFSNLRAVFLTMSLFNLAALAYLFARKYKGRNKGITLNPEGY